MRELAEIIIIYGSIAAGFVTFWLGVYWGNPLDTAILRALVAGGAFFVFGFIVRLLALVVVLMGGGGDADMVIDQEETLDAYEESGPE